MIIVRYIIFNILLIIIIVVILMIVILILMELLFSFLGLGIRELDFFWGSMLNNV